MFPFGFGCGCGSSSERREVTREVVREVVMISCKYCGALFSTNSNVLSQLWSKENSLKIKKIKV